MIIHSSPLFTIYFGNAQDRLNQDDYLSIPPETDLLTEPHFKHLADVLGIESLVFLKQIHKNTGFVVTQETLANLARPFAVEGDYLLTDLPKVGIGIMTADCLPIIIHDTRTNAIAAIHAGWRGSVERIAQRAFKRMQEAYGTRGVDVRVFFGSSAQPCCYEVGDTVLAHRDTDPLLSDSLLEHNGSTYLNVSRYNALQLMDVGVPKLAFHMNYNICTICDVRLCSYRRDGKSPYRQMTVVALR
jgi:YfiH family protein